MKETSFSRFCSRCEKKLHWVTVFFSDDLCRDCQDAKIDALNQLYREKAMTDFKKEREQKEKMVKQWKKELKNKVFK